MERDDFAKLNTLPQLLLPWYSQNKRSLPWRETNDPYKIWVSEIMLQQTRVEAVKERYVRFIAQLPDIAALAACGEEQLLKLWEGLGYYSRARNLKKAAQQVLDCFGGEFPAELSEIRSLIGIGDYTAGAIASIAFGKRAAAVDGNVLRVLARYLPINEDVASASLKRKLGDKLTSVYPQSGADCGSFTQALMELGATVCLPNGAPRCSCCPLMDSCFAFANNSQSNLPVKTQKQKRKKEHKTVLLLRCGELLALQKRPPEGLLGGMWQLPCFDGKLTQTELWHKLQQLNLHIASLCCHGTKKHIFTHIEWQMYCYEVMTDNTHSFFTWASEQQLKQQYALPTAFKQFLE